MTLGFSTKIKNEQNFFIEKIWKCLSHTAVAPAYNDYLTLHEQRFGKQWDILFKQNGWREHLHPKQHSIRRDKNNHWRAGMNIHMVINNRTSDRFQFAPVLKCKSVQKIEISDISHKSRTPGVGVVIGYPVKNEIFYLYWSVRVDGKELNEYQILKLALNDGFKSTKDFFAYFDKGFTGNLIHWTDLIY